MNFYIDYREKNRLKSSQKAFGQKTYNLRKCRFNRCQNIPNINTCLGSFWKLQCSEKGFDYKHKSIQGENVILFLQVPHILYYILLCILSNYFVFWLYKAIFVTMSIVALVSDEAHCLLFFFYFLVGTVHAWRTFTDRGKVRSYLGFMYVLRLS